MALSIKDPEADRLARTLAARTGQSLTAAIVTALREELRRTAAAQPASLADDLMEIAVRCSALPVLDPRTDDELVGYDPSGLPR